MSVRNLEFALQPKSVAVFGASEREGSVGRVVLNNILGAGFEGPVWPVNPRHDEVLGLPCFARAADLPGIPDLGIIVTPPRSVPGIIADLGEKGTRAVVVITADLTDQNGLRPKMLDAARPHLLRIIGPNTVGLMVPPARLNASFSHMPAKAGNLALLSQSGAIVTSLIDWAAEKGIGFSQIVSLGDMADVDVGDYLDMLAGDRETSAILMYLETVPSPRKFMSAARAAARIKPVIVVKAGRHEQAAKAAATHTGALSGVDRVVDAALRRAGILRVGGLADLFDAAETLARFPPIERARVGIVTNGGGAGVLAVDQLMDTAGELAQLSAGTIADLDTKLPANWSRANPVDIIGDASPERYRTAIEAVAKDEGVDALLVMSCPSGLASPVDAAHAVAGLVEKGRVNGKPFLSCWLGEHTARQARTVMNAAGVAGFDTPAAAARAVSYLNGWALIRKSLSRVPPAGGSEEVDGRRDEVEEIFRACAAEDRRMLTEPEAKAVLAAYGISVPETRIARTPREAGRIAGEILKGVERVVVKLLSRAITHKSDIGGVILGIETARAAEEAARGIEERARTLAPQAAIDGYAVQPMVEMKHAHELILGVSRDPVFGPVILFGAGGTAVEVIDDTAIALPPLDDVLAGDLIARTRISRLLAGYRDRPPADRAAILRALNAVSGLIVDFPCVAALDINPLLVSADGASALDARIEIDPARVGEPGPNPDLTIRPYPQEWQTTFASDTGGRFSIRPIRPIDVELYPDFLAKVSPGDIRLRFLAPRRNFPDEALKRLTQLDYDRDMAFVAIDAETGELAGVARLSCDPDRQKAEYGLLVRSDMQGYGLGWALMERLIAFSRAEGIGRIEGMILNENSRMLLMCHEFGFHIELDPADNSVSIATLTLGS